MFSFQRKMVLNPIADIDGPDAMFEPSAEFVRVPVVDVHKGNLAAHLEEMKKAISSASFIALDCVGL